MLSYRSTYQQNLDFFLGPLISKYFFISTDRSEFNEIFRIPEKIELGEKYSFKLGGFWLHVFCVSDENENTIVRIFEFPCIVGDKSSYNIGLVMSKTGFNRFISDVKNCLYKNLSGEFIYIRFPYLHTNNVILEFSLVTKEYYKEEVDSRKNIQINDNYLDDNYAVLHTAPNIYDFNTNIDTILDICVDCKVLKER